MSEFDTVVAVAEGKFNGDNCRPNFHLKAVRLDGESEKHGRDIFKDFEYVEIIIPGHRKSTVDRKVRDEDKLRWPREYAAWKANRELPLEGTPLEKWTLVSPADVENLKFMNVRTVEQLSKLSDAACQDCGMGARKLRALAQEWLEQAKGNSGISQMAAKTESLENRVLELERQLTETLKENRALKARAEEDEEEDEPAPPKRRRTKAASTPEHELP